MASTASILKAFMLVFILIPLSVGLFRVNGDASGHVLYFNYVSEVLRDREGSMFIYYQADEAPVYSDSPQRTTFRTAVKKTYLWMEVYVGGVAWLTQPLTQDLKVEGKVEMHVWLSSDDPNHGWASGYGGGIAEIDENGKPVYGPVYDVSYRMGRAVGNTPEEYTSAFNVQHVFKKGHRVMFGFVVGSTVQGWTATAYFSSKDKPSYVILPPVGEVKTERLRISNPEYVEGILKLSLQNIGENAVTLQGALVNGEPKPMYMPVNTLQPGDSATVMIV